MIGLLGWQSTVCCKTHFVSAALFGHDDQEWDVHARVGGSSETVISKRSWVTHGLLHISGRTKYSICPTRAFYPTTQIELFAQITSSTRIPDWVLVSESDLCSVSIHNLLILYLLSQFRVSGPLPVALQGDEDDFRSWTQSIFKNWCESSFRKNTTWFGTLLPSTTQKWRTDNIYPSNPIPIPENHITKIMLNEFDPKTLKSPNTCFRHTQMCMHSVYYRN